MKALLAFLLAPVLIEIKGKGPDGMESTVVCRELQSSIFFAPDWTSDEIDAAAASADGHADKIEVDVQPSPENRIAQ